ncbi:MAG: glycosyltransferase family 4 protein [Pseudomonadales bacterium]|nr:glycosyltransferase family 4 protein [Pseudomonadales bacterium]
MKRPLKIALVTQFPVNPDHPTGGVEAVSVNLAKHLAKFSDLDVHVITFVKRAAAGQLYRWENVSIHYLALPEGSMLRMATGEGRRRILEHLSTLQADVVHAHDTYGLMVRGHPGPRTFTVHGFIYGDTRVSGSPFALPRSWLWRYVETGGWAEQKNIVSISPYVRERVSRFSAARIRDIDNPVAASFFSLPWKPEPNRIFSAAVISPRKNTLQLVRACGVLKARGQDIRLRLAGPIVDAGYGRQVQALIQELDLDDNVLLLGSIPTTEVRMELSKAAAFALVSLEENSPMGIEEAMAVGLPVITSNRCGMPYMVRHGESGYLVDPTSAENIADGIQATLRSEAHRRALGARGRRIAEERFHPDVVAKQTRAHYLELVGIDPGSLPPP